MIEATAEQQAFCKEVWEGRPCYLSARAGTGKTSTIKLALEGPVSDITVVAFNKQNQVDLAKALGMKAKVSTLHALGFAALRGYMPGLELDNSKLFELTKSQGLRGRKPRERFSDTMRAVSCAKNWGILPAPLSGQRWKAGLIADTPEAWLKLQEHFELWEADLEAAREILQRSNDAFIKERKIDFDDMVYLPVMLGLRVFATSKMIVDEAQDLSPLNLAMLRKSPAKIWYVGDPYQCIYSWRGADEDTIEQIGLPVLPLTTCWRCDSQIIRKAQTWVGDIKAREEAPAGEVREVLWMPDWKKYKPATVLGRRNSSLVSLALSMREENLQVCILGRDLVKTLSQILDELKGTTREALLRSLEAWQESMMNKYPHRMGEFDDYARCLKALILNHHGKQAILRGINQLFSDEPKPDAWLLSTIHKAKGREWDTVWLLDWEGQGLTQPWQRKEERNLRYVACTRAKSFLGIIDEAAWNPEAKKDWREVSA